MENHNVLINLNSLKSGSDRAFARSVQDKIARKLPAVVSRCKDIIPYTTGKDGRYDDRSDLSRFGDDWSIGLSWWTNGFWPGILWQMYHATKDERYRIPAEKTEQKMDDCFSHFDGLHHDVGFMWMPMAVADYKLTGNHASRIRGLHAASLLAGRFNPKGRFIRAWNDVENEDTRGWAIIDCMFNLSLLYWATEETGDPRFREIAMMHADTVMRNFIRPDGSSNHIVEFDPFTGEVKRTRGGQGYENGSAWTRGQAWAIYGFVISYLHTGTIAFLATAEKVADFFLSHMREDAIIPVDFFQPEEPDYEDSCAAAIAAGGLLELADAVLASADRREKGERYYQAALRILRTLDAKRADYSDDCDAFLQNCSAAYHDQEHHITMVYADYYYLEAILKLTGEGFFIW